MGLEPKAVLGDGVTGWLGKEQFWSNPDKQNRTRIGFSPSECTNGENAKAEVRMNKGKMGPPGPRSQTALAHQGGSQQLFITQAQNSI